MKKILTEEFTKESIDYLNNADLKKRKNLGQYFTPKSIRELLISKLPKKRKCRYSRPSMRQRRIFAFLRKIF